MLGAFITGAPAPYLTVPAAMPAERQKKKPISKRRFISQYPSRKMNPVVPLPVMVTAVAERAVTTAAAGPFVVTIAGVYVKRAGNV
jgi:hypothetical protein